MRQKMHVLELMKKERIAFRTRCAKRPPNFQGTFTLKLTQIYKLSATVLSTHNWFLGKSSQKFKELRLLITFKAGTFSSWPSQSLDLLGLMHILVYSFFTWTYFQNTFHSPGFIPSIKFIHLDLFPKYSSFTWIYSFNKVHSPELIP